MLEVSSQADNTLIIYTSDRGDHYGDHGLWTKMTLCDESLVVPVTFAGPGIPEIRFVSIPTSLVDIYPIIPRAAGAQDDAVALPESSRKSEAVLDSDEIDFTPAE